MEHYGNAIADKPLNQLILPGTHDSGTYQLTNEIAKNQDISDKINKLKYIGVGFIVNSVIKKWSKTQDKNIYDQLKSGVRYLDLRLSYWDDKNDFYVTHGLFGPKFSDVAAQISRFLNENPKEILVIQIGDMNYLGVESKAQSNQEKLIKFIESTFKGKLAQKSKIAGPISMVRDFWKNGYQIFLIYKDKEMSNQSDVLWHRKSVIDNYWPNVDNADQLKKKLDEHMNKRTANNNGEKFYVVQSQVTANNKTIENGLNPLSSKPKSLEDLAKIVNAKFPAWLNEWATRNPNIIITDFTSSKMAQAIYELNKN